MEIPKLLSKTDKLNTLFFFFTKHFLYLSETEYTKQVFFQNIFIGKGLKMILIIHIWSQFCFNIGF